MFFAFGAVVVTIYEKYAFWSSLGSWMPPGCLLGASWVLPGCLLDASWVLPGCLLPNTRMSLPKIQEPPLNPLGKQIIMKWIYYKWKMQIRFYPKNLDPTGRYHGKSSFLQKTWYRVLFRPVILPLAVWPHHGRRGRFRQKIVNIRSWFYPKSRISRFWGKNSIQFQRWYDQ